MNQKALLLVVVTLLAGARSVGHDAKGFAAA